MIEQTRGYKYRIYPNKSQKEQLNKTFGCCRFVYNHFLAVRTNSYKETGKSVGYLECSRQLTQLKTKEEFSWLKEADSVALQESLRNLDTAFDNFFDKHTGYPQFKSKHNHCFSYRTRNQNNGVRLEDDYIIIPKVGKVYIDLTRSFNGKINDITVEKTSTGKYYVSINVTELVEPTASTGAVIGIDVGLKCFYTDSNGNKVDNPKHLHFYEKKLKRAQRRLSLKKKGSKNRNKQRIVVSKIHERIKNIRNDFLHKKSTKLVKENQIICIEDLNIKGMVKNRHLSKTISDVAWGKFFRMLEYKAPLYGSEIRKIPTFFPSSQTCSCCGHKNVNVKDLSVRNWVCPECGAKHDRDKNASLNILLKGLQVA